MKLSIRLLYLYLFSFVGLLIVIIGSTQLVDLTIKSTLFPDVDVYYYSSPQKVTNGQDCLEGICEEVVSEEMLKQQAETEARKSRQRQLSSSISMIVIGLPVYLYHWKLIKKERE